MQPSQEASQRITKILLGIIATGVIVTALVWARSVILPFAYAIFGAYTIEPILRRMERIHIPRWLGAIVVVGVLFAAFAGTMGVLAAAAKRLDARLPEYLTTVQQLLDRLPIPDDVRPHVDDPDTLRNLALAVFGNVGNIAGALTTVLSNVGLVLVLTIAVTLGRKKFDARLQQVAREASTDGARSAKMLDTFEEKIQRYMLVKAAVSLAMGVSFTLVLLAFGFDLAVLAGFFMMLLNFIPTFGPVIALVPVIALHILENSGNPGFAIAASLATIAVPLVFVNFVEPKLFGEQLGLNFLAVILALLVWGLIWGLPGAILAVPLTVGVSLVCRQVPTLKGVHDLLRE
ncbi:MAG: AI-2E family transporter [Polyangiaceae bacterium]|nr:AI-2E family transporter [Polyangiaceae bacterium]